MAAICVDVCFMHEDKLFPATAQVDQDDQWLDEALSQTFPATRFIQVASDLLKKGGILKLKIVAHHLARGSLLSSALLRPLVAA